jgi:hypothetical protein
MKHASVTARSVHFMRDPTTLRETPRAHRTLPRDVDPKMSPPGRRITRADHSVPSRRRRGARNFEPIVQTASVRMSSLIPSPSISELRDQRERNERLGIDVSREGTPPPLKRSDAIVYASATRFLSKHSCRARPFGNARVHQTRDSFEPSALLRSQTEYGCKTPVCFPSRRLGCKSD